MFSTLIITIITAHHHHRTLLINLVTLPRLLHHLASSLRLPEPSPVGNETSGSPSCDRRALLKVLEPYSTCVNGSWCHNWGHRGFLTPFLPAPTPLFLHTTSSMSSWGCFYISFILIWPFYPVLQKNQFCEADLISRYNPFIWCWSDPFTVEISDFWI